MSKQFSVSRLHCALRKYWPAQWLCPDFIWLFAFCRVVYSVLFDSWEIVGPYRAWWLLNGLLLVLQALHVIWFYLIAQIAIKAIFKGKVSPDPLSCSILRTLTGLSDCCCYFDATLVQILPQYGLHVSISATVLHAKNESRSHSPVVCQTADLGNADVAAQVFTGKPSCVSEFLHFFQFFDNFSRQPGLCSFFCLNRFAFFFFLLAWRSGVERRPQRHWEQLRRGDLFQWQ